MALFGKTKAKARSLAKTRSASPPPVTPPVISELDPNSPVVSLVIADVALRAGDALLRRTIELGLLKGKDAPGRVIRGRTITETMIGTVLAGIARRSVPGAILVGGGLLAKTLSDRRHARRLKGD